MIYDIIVGETLPTKYDYNYLKGTYVNRIEMDEITSYQDLAKVISMSLKEYANRTTEPIDTVMNVISELDMAKTSQMEDSEMDEKIRELLSALAYVGLDMYIIRRPDMDSANIEDTSARAYMIDKQDKFFPTINRVVNGQSIMFDEKINANISTVVMQFLNDLRFNDIVEDTVNLNSYREKFESLEESNMGWSLNTDRLIEFLSDYGYKFVVVV